MSSRIERLAGSSKSIRRRATVTISVPEADERGARLVAGRYLPVPSIRRLAKVRPAMTSGASAATG
jgi:hypothetical protein